MPWPKSKSLRRCVIAFAAITALWLIEEIVRLTTSPSEFEIATAHICTACGVRRWVQQKGIFNDPDTVATKETFEATPLSEWYTKHFGEHSEHLWQQLHQTTSNYATVLGIRWNTSTGVGCRMDADLIYLSDTDRKLLDEQFEKDAEACKGAISERLDRRLSDLGGAPP